MDREFILMGLWALNSEKPKERGIQFNLDTDIMNSVGINEKLLISKISNSKISYETAVKILDQLHDIENLYKKYEKLADKDEKDKLMESIKSKVSKLKQQIKI